MSVEDIADLIKDYHGWPKPNVTFKDITPLLLHPRLYREALTFMIRPFEDVDKVAGCEARGFPFGVHAALLLNAGFVMVRKKGKLPGECRSLEYATEYSIDTIEIKADNISQGDKVVIVDDVLATGGTAKACFELLTSMGANVVGFSFLLELPELGGRKALEPTEVQVESLIKFL